MNRANKQRGSMLAELMVGVIFVGVALGPLLFYATKIQDLNNAISQQARQEAWRSVNDQAIAAGIDPSLAPGLAHTLNPAVPAVNALQVTQTTVAPVAGLAQVVPIHAVLDGTIAEKRIAGAGFQLGPGLSVDPRTTPTAPLTPIVMPAPAVTPTDGSEIATTDLTAAGAGQPYTLNVQAASIAGSTVTLILNQPNATDQGSGGTQHTVTAVDLLNRVNGRAWTQYTGDAPGGDEAVTLGDGRVRWLVHRSDGRLQIYEPSANVNFAYKIALGAPIVDRGGQENVGGATVTFDYAGFYAVQSGATPLTLDYPDAVKAVFGNSWDAQLFTYNWTFHAVAGPLSGDMKQFFQSDALTYWDDTVAVAAAPSAPVGATVADASWTFSRTKTQLGIPVKGATADGTGFYAPGQMQFSAPTSADGTAVGRPSVDNTVSTSTTVNVQVIP